MLSLFYAACVIFYRRPFRNFYVVHGPPCRGPPKFESFLSSTASTATERRIPRLFYVEKRWNALVKKKLKSHFSRTQTLGRYVFNARRCTTKFILTFFSRESRYIVSNNGHGKFVFFFVYNTGDGGFHKIQHGLLFVTLARIIYFYDLYVFDGLFACQKRPVYWRFVLNF